MMALKRTSPIAKASTASGLFDRLQGLIDSILATFFSRM